jgi:cytochrome c
MNFAGKPAIINLTPTEGVQDVYLVFQNPNPDAKQLMVVMGIEFKSDAGNEEAKPQAKTEASYDEYAGKYKMTGLPFEFVEVKSEGGKISIDANGQGGEMKSTSTPDKFDVGGKATVVFLRDEKSKVVKIKVLVMGSDFEGTKQ